MIGGEPERMKLVVGYVVTIKGVQGAAAGRLCESLPPLSF